MNADSLYPLSIEQAEVDLFLANAAIQKAEELSSGKGKYYRINFFTPCFFFRSNDYWKLM